MGCHRRQGSSGMGAQFDGGRAWCAVPMISGRKIATCSAATKVDKNEQGQRKKMVESREKEDRPDEFGSGSTTIQ